jgi:hypothetical protein
MEGEPPESWEGCSVTHDGYDETVAELSAPLTSMTGVADTLVRLFPVAGASISTVGDFLGNETVSASDDLAARIDELQFDLGEGPCWDALATGRPVLAPDLRGSSHERWPLFSPAASREQVGALFAFPMIVGHLRIGAIDLYSGAPTELEPQHARQAARLAGLVGQNILRLSVIEANNDSGGESKHSRRTIHQATGMLIAQLDLSAEEAGLVLQGHAFAAGRSMMSVADDILAGRLSFHAGPDGIEERG